MQSEHHATYWDPGCSLCCHDGRFGCLIHRQLSCHCYRGNHFSFELDRFRVCFEHCYCDCFIYCRKSSLSFLASLVTNSSTELVCCGFSKRHWRSEQHHFRLVRYARLSLRAELFHVLAVTSFFVTRFRTTSCS